MEQAFRASTGSLFKGGPADMYERFVAASWDPEKALRAYSPLMRDEQIRFDTAVMQTFQQRLRVTRRLIELGLVERVDNPFRVSELEYEKADAPGGGVQRSMSPIPRLDFEKPDQSIVRVPIYFTSAMFQLDLRSLETSRNKGQPLDTTIAIRKTRAIVEDIEDAVINGGLPTISGYASHGLLDAPSIQTLSSTTGAWDAVGKTGEQMLQDVVDAIALAESKNSFGPYDLLLNTAWFNATRNDFKAASDKSILQRLREVEAGAGPIYIYVADKVPTDTAVLYPRNVENVRLIVGNVGGATAPEQQTEPDNKITPISLFPWDTYGGFIKNWLITCVVIPDTRDTGASETGIVKIVPETT